MKQRLVCTAVLFILILTLCSCAYAESKIAAESPVTVTPVEAVEETTEERIQKSEALTSGESQRAEEMLSTDKIAGVSIDFDYTRMSGKASNQIAIWVEDNTGAVIKTLFVTDFTASRRGYRSREDALEFWVQATNPENISDTDIDAISSATPAPGAQHFEWDLTDNDGQIVQEGKYCIKLEGTLYWSSNVLYTGMIDIGITAPGELEVSVERSEPDNTDNETMVQNVRMAAMERKQAHIDNTANWLGGLEPSKALAYMKEHYDDSLVIVEVNTDYWKLQTGFVGAMHIPHDQIAERYEEIPPGVPVILHCGGGIVSVPAYETLIEKRPDIPQLSYIAGRPLVTEFNAWLDEHSK